MAGCLLGHILVQPATVLDHIEFGEIDQPEFGDKKLAHDFLGMFFGLWNVVAEHRQPGKPFAFSQITSQPKTEDTKEWLRIAETTAIEMGEFLVGLELAETPTLLELEGDFDEVDSSNYLPHLIANHQETLDDESRKLKKRKSSDAGGIINIIQAVDRDMKKYHSPFLRFMSSIQVVPEPIVRSAPKIVEGTMLAGAAAARNSSSAAFSKVIDGAGNPGCQEVRA